MWKRSSFQWEFRRHAAGERIRGPLENSDEEKGKKKDWIAHVGIWMLLIAALFQNAIVQRIFPHFPFDPVGMRVSAFVQYALLGCWGFFFHRLGRRWTFRPAAVPSLSWAGVGLAAVMLGIRLGGASYGIFPPIVAQSDLFFGVMALYGGASLSAALFSAED